MSSFIFLLLLFPLVAVVVVQGYVEDCMPIRCSKHSPIIRFPFRHQTLQPQHCGYPGFDLNCDHKKDTVLVLPFSVNVVVKEINYASQTILVYDPECLPQKLPHLNLSTSSFNFLLDHDYLISDCAIYKCSDADKSLYRFPCLIDPINKYYIVNTIQELTSCTKIHDILDVPWSISDKNGFRLEWSEPTCGHCEAQGKRCSLHNSTRLDSIQCIDKQPTIIHHDYHLSKEIFCLLVTEALKKRLIAGFGCFLAVIILVALVHQYIRFRTGRENQIKVEKFLQDYRALKPSRFSYSDITRITHQFRDKLGEGGYGVVYKGKLNNEIDVAVKVLNNSKGNGEEFVNEVSTIGRIHHVNIVRLVGFCADGFRRALVYEFLRNDSLEKIIFQAGSKKISLDWEKLKDIALGIARGIEYLHEGCDQQILHFDIKPQNVLLDHNFNPKICDFGLAKLCSKEQSAVTMTAARGTMGYIAPEVLSRTFGRVSYKSDVYSFGMLLLEMVGGRKNEDRNVNNTSPVYFPQWIYNHINAEDNPMWEQIDEEGNSIARKLSIVGLWCIQWCPTDRPSMKVVVQMLEGDNGDLTMPPNPFPATTNSVGAGHYQTEMAIILEE
ncbi:PREDICTED: glycerophosphodiester phosphodiesterase protein kinase domain-containing GDPDL2-like [Erythranthe guttata]|uniref:glycerophosphodiester phosphodiesterase protein kinase domain-containing GDPDL2-like n=1 Tax=Erythranthe guttata TaxID=4155 RepID=UPI00064E1275|nr:PREDICTED: glycerophosphodiester phosphodiesterase protein kinase domain-containing GDPDL2-like [Erythranthe guttata]|eukprot:XP_012833989.1 PREDICTED: glycerophosphodiester phosphodiesterase protein kinase domain-containing GDPDL2-like [Erythranthe guttata]